MTLTFKPPHREPPREPAEALSSELPDPPSSPAPVDEDSSDAPESAVAWYGASSDGAPPADQPAPSDAGSEAATRKPINPALALSIATVTALAGLLAWGAVSNFKSQGNDRSYWESIPAGQPYNLGHPTPMMPSASSTQDSDAGSAMPMGSAPSSDSDNAGAMSQAALPSMVATKASTAVTLNVNPPPVAGNYGSDGDVHDVFSPAFFSVPAGKAVHVTVYNYDDMAHSFTSTALGLNVWVPPGTDDHPSKVSFTFTAPSTGNYYWLCAVPCDRYAMQTGGYMEGEIHAIKAS